MLGLFAFFLLHIPLGYGHFFISLHFTCISHTYASVCVYGFGLELTNHTHSKKTQENKIKERRNSIQIHAVDV